jgi:hypothetical protein
MNSFLIGDLEFGITRVVQGEILRPTLSSAGFLPEYSSHR